MVFIPCFKYRYQKLITNPAINITQLQLKSSTTGCLCILGFGAIPTTAVTTSTTWALQLGRIPTTFGAVTIAVAADIIKESQASPTSSVVLGTSATGSTASGEPTYTDKWVKGGNALSPIEEIYLPELRKTVQASAGVGLLSLLAPPAGTYMYWIDFAEIL